MTPQSATQVLDAYYLEARCKILDLAAILDRVDRGSGTADDRLTRLKEAVELLLNTTGASRAEAIQQHFSLQYQPEWVLPQPRDYVAAD